MSTEQRLGITRRGLLGATGAGIAGVALGLGSTETASATTQPATLEQLNPDDRAFVEAALDKYSEDDIALRTSNPFIYKGMRCVALQGGIVQDHPDGLTLLNSLDEFKEYDQFFKEFYQVPPHEDYSDGTEPWETNEAFKKRVDHFGIDSDIAEWASEKRASFEIGVPTAHQKKEGPFTMARFQRYVAQRVDDGPEKGDIRRVLVGDMVKNIGRTIVDANGNVKTIPGPKIIPDEALLPEPEKRAVGGGGETQPLTAKEFLDKAQLVDSAEKNGIRLESFITSTSGFQTNINPEVKDRLMSRLARDAEYFNRPYISDHFPYEKARVAVLNSFEELPVEISSQISNPLRTEDGIPWNSGVNLGAYDGTGERKTVNIGFFASQRTADGVILYYIPIPTLDLSTPFLSKAINQAMTLKLLATSISGGDLTAMKLLNNDSEAFELSNEEALEISKR